jgi:conjugative transfer signal peptidase TraF
MRWGGFFEQDNAVRHNAAKSLPFQGASCRTPGSRTAKFYGAAGRRTVHSRPRSCAAPMPFFRRSACQLAAILVRRWPVSVLLVCIAIVGGTWLWGLRLNMSRSAPRGLYRTLATSPARGAFIAACLPPEVARFGRTRGYVGPGDCPGDVQAVIKQVIAGPGDTVDVNPAGVVVNGRLVPSSATAAADSAGRPLPHVTWGRHVVPREHVWLHGPGDARSWDSRYFGPLGVAQIRATVTPVLTLD